MAEKPAIFRSFPRPLRAVAIAILFVLLLPYLITPLYSVVDPVSTVMLWRRLSGARVERQYVPIARISPALPLTVIIAEDGRFCSHHGIDPTEIREAITEAAAIRLRPILMTGIAAVLGLTPMALFGGANIPLARAVVGGILAALALVLFVVPVLYVLFKREKAAA